MAQQVVHARAIIPASSSLIDSASFDIAIEQLGTSPTLVYSTVAAKIVSFLNTPAGGALSAPAAYLDPVYSRGANACSIELYDITNKLNGAPAGAPVWVSYFTLAGLYAALPGPEGTCILIDYRSDYGTDVEYLPGQRPRSRDRNRIYFGGMLAEYQEETGTNRCIWATRVITDFSLALVALNTSAGTSDVPTWVQWSRKNASVKPITHIQLQDAPRYQRRRADSGSPHIVV
jgi:hypothetical protein